MTQGFFRDANCVMVCGELTARPVLKSGRTTAYAQLTLRCSRGKTYDEFRIALFGGGAEAALSTLAQGDRVAVFGRLAMRERATAAGTRYQSLAFQAENFLKLPTSPQPWEAAPQCGGRDGFTVGPDFLDAEQPEDPVQLPF